MISDPFGRVFKAYLEGKTSQHFTERDDGYIEEIPDASIYFALYDEWPEYESYADFPPDWAENISVSCSS